MVTINFGTFPKVTVLDGLAPSLKQDSKSSILLAEKQKAKGLIPLATKSGEIMLVHPGIVIDKQWESSQFKLKGKTCNVISLAQDDDLVMVVSLNSSEEKFAFMAQPTTSQPIGTWSEKQYLRQYNQIPDET